MLAWDDETRQESLVLNGTVGPGLRARSPWAIPVMIERDSWSSLYFKVSGEMCRSLEDKLMRKLRTRMFSLIKSERQGREGD